MNRIVCVLLALLGCALPAAGQGSFDAGVAAYRSGDYAGAEAIWKDLLSEVPSGDQRALIYYDIANALYRQGDLMESVAWYSASVRLRPRDADAWANLELVRAEAGLEPADRGDLKSTLRRLCTSVTPLEGRALFLAALALWALALLGEALRGGALWRALAWMGFAGVLLASAPLVWRATRPPGDPHLVVAAPSVPVRGEPLQARSPIGQLDAGEEVRRIDALPDWIRVSTSSGVEGWIPKSAALPLEP